MKIFLNLLLLTFSLNSFGQISSKNEIYGKWKVEETIKQKVNPQSQSIIDELINSVFLFNSNSNFTFTTLSKSEFAGMIVEMTKGNQWKFSQNEQFIDIGTEANQYNTMRILIKKINGKIVFHLAETEIMLEMKKID